MADQNAVSSDWLADNLTGRSAPTIADDIAVLIRKGAIKPDAQLPSVRALALRLGVSPSTVSTSWTRLKQQGLIVSRGRAGTRVVGERPTPYPARYQANPNYDPTIPINLSVSAPDPALLPDLPAALLHASGPNLNSYERERITQALEAAVKPTWPYPPQSLLTTNAGYEGVQLVLSTFVRAGDRIVLESPALPRMVDRAEALGARMLFVDRDAEGMRPDVLAERLQMAPTLVLLQPGINNPVGSSTTPARARQIAAMLATTETLIVEVDQQNALFPEKVSALSALVSDNHVYIRSYSKAYGPDLRIAVMEGPESIIEKVHAFLEYGSGWTSRPLQNALAWMLTDPQTQQLIRQSAETYRSRARALRSQLERRGLSVSNGLGLELAVAVRDEQYAAGYLRSAGIAVGVGSNFTDDAANPWIRISTARLKESEAERIANIVAAAAE